jgi:hypothetical protein
MVMLAAQGGSRKNCHAWHLIETPEWARVSFVGVIGSTGKRTEPVRPPERGLEEAFKRAVTANSGTCSGVVASSDKSSPLAAGQIA